MIIAVDFDGTICQWAKYPAIGEPVPGAIQTLQDMTLEGGHKIVLWTCRQGKPLHDAVRYLLERGVRLYGVNEIPDLPLSRHGPKPDADVFIDDKAFGCPLVRRADGRRPYVDWRAVQRQYRIGRLES